MTIIDALDALVGRPYTPVLSDYVIDGDTVTSVVASGAAGVDWPYVLIVALVGVVIYSMIRLLWGVFRR